MADPRKYAHYNESIERVIKNTQVAVSNSFATTHPAVAATTANSNTSVLANPVSSAAINPPAVSTSGRVPTNNYYPESTLYLSFLSFSSNVSDPFFNF